MAERFFNLPHQDQREALGVAATSSGRPTSGHAHQAYILGEGHCHARLLPLEEEILFIEDEIIRGDTVSACREPPKHVQTRVL